MAHIVGERVMLREYREEDIEHIRGWVNKPEVTSTLSNIFIRPHTEQMMRSFLDHVMRNSDPNAFYFVIADKRDEGYLGQVDITGIDWYVRTGSLGVVIPDVDNRGQGYGTEALTLLIRYAFDRINLNKIELDVYEFNAGAYELYRRLGFVEEGRRRANVYRDGRYYDVILMGVFPQEFRGATAV
jgi:RimJ/RimL family protein N-acetyltransferase